MLRASISLFLLFNAASAAFGSVDSGLISLLPAGTKAVFSVGVQDARDTEFGQFVLRNIHFDDADMTKFMSQTGFDPRRDLQTLVVATNTLGRGADTKGSFAVLARGSFDAAKITTVAQQHGSRLQTIDGVDVYLQPDAKAATPHGFAFLGADVAAMGDLNSLKQMIANRAAPSQLDPDLDDLIRKAGAGQDLWFASAGFANQFASAAMPETGGEHQQQALQALQGVVRSSGGIKLGTTVHFSFNAVARSDKDANSLGDVIRFLASAAQLRRDQDPQAQALGPALDNLNLTTNGNEVHVTTAVPETMLEQLGPVIGASHPRPQTHPRMH